MARYAILQSFYVGKPWTKLRLVLIAERGPVCQKCGKVITDPADVIGHHIIELTVENVNNPNISLNPDNILLVCGNCHEAIHERFGHTPEKKIYIVYGPPLAGKKTFVKQRMKRGDLIIDIDAIYRAVSGLELYDKPNNLITNVMAVQKTLIDNLKTRYGKWRNAYIIGGYPDKYKRETLADDLGAELVFCDTNRDECLYRLQADSGRALRKDEWTKYINEWFDRYVA
jgi:predicted kinase